MTSQSFVGIKMDARATMRALSNLEQEQFPFAFAKALSETAKMAQKAVRQETRNRFNLHTEYIPRGILVQFARKSDFVKFGFAHSAVFTSDKITPFMAWHETGGTKRPRGRMLAVPGPDLSSMSESQWKTASGKVKSSFRPKKLLSKKTPKKGSRKMGGLTQRPFIIRSKGNKRALIVRRIGHGPRSLEVLYVFQPNVSIDRTWRFEPTVKKVVDRVFESQFKFQLKLAVANAR